jgi:hypothetical protein
MVAERNYCRVLERSGADLNELRQVRARIVQRGKQQQRVGSPNGSDAKPKKKKPAVAAPVEEPAPAPAPRDVRIFSDPVRSAADGLIG